MRNCRSAARWKPLPPTGIWDAQRAVFGSGYGMEHVNYFAPEGEERFEVPSLPPLERA